MDETGFSANPSAAPAPLHRPVLPPVSEFLRDTIRLGANSLRTALPVLVLLYFYRFGMGLYLVLTGTGSSPLGFPDYQARAFTTIVTAAAYLPLLVLVYTPFLPHQDAVLRRQPRPMIDCVKYVLEILWPYSVSSFVQLLIIATPALVIIVGAGLVSVALGSGDPRLAAVFVILAVFPALVWTFASFFFVSFATPLLVLDGWGPVASIGESVRLVRRHFGGLFGRVFVFGVLLVFAMLFLSFPSSILAVVSRASGTTNIVAEIARLVWESGVAAASFPFSVAGLLILYRALVPVSARTLELAGAAGAPAPAGEAAGAGAGAVGPAPSGAAPGREPPEPTTPAYPFE